MVEAHVLLGSGKRTRYTFAILAWSVSRVCDKKYRFRTSSCFGEDCHGLHRHCGGIAGCSCVSMSPSPARLARCAVKSIVQYCTTVPTGLYRINRAAAAMSVLKALERYAAVWTKEVEPALTGLGA